MTEKMTWGEFKAYVERDCEGLTDETPMGFVDVRNFSRARAGRIVADIDDRDELCIR